MPQQNKRPSIQSIVNNFSMLFSGGLVARYSCEFEVPYGRPSPGPADCTRKIIAQL